MTLDQFIRSRQSFWFKLCEWFLSIKVIQYLRLLWNIREMYLALEQCSRSLGRTRPLTVDNKINCPDRDISLEMCYRILSVRLNGAVKENDRRFRERLKNE